MKVSLRKLDVLLHKIQKDHNDYRSDPYWKGEPVSHSDPEYVGLSNEDAMRKREVDFHALSKDARKQLGLMEQLTQVSPDCRHLHGRRLAFQRNGPGPPVCMRRIQRQIAWAAGV